MDHPVWQKLQRQNPARIEFWIGYRIDMTDLHGEKTKRK